MHFTPTEIDEYYDAKDRHQPDERDPWPLTLFTLWCIVGVLTLFCMAFVLAPTGEDFTDTGVGCIDDCLEPAIEDEADSLVSMGRVEL